MTDNFKIGDLVYKVGTEIHGRVKEINPRTVKFVFNGKTIKCKRSRVKNYDYR